MPSQWLQRLPSPQNEGAGKYRPALVQVPIAAAERGDNNSKYFKDVRSENGSSQGQNLASTVLYVPCSRDSGGGKP